MRTFATAVIATLLLAAPLAAAETTRIPEAALARAEGLRAQALADDTAWRVIESLTTEVGPRLAGSEADARAVAWAKAKFAELGYERIWTEPVTFPIVFRTWRPEYLYVEEGWRVVEQFYGLEGC